MKLGATEKHLKTYDYYQSNKHHSGTLVVTDRRIVSIRKDKHHEKHAEVRIQDICSIEAGYKRKVHSSVGLALMIIGGILLLLGIFLPRLIGGKITEMADLISLIGWSVAGVGLLIALIGLAVFLQKKLSVYLVINTNQRVGYSLGMYVANDTLEKARHIKKHSNHRNGKRMRIYINEEAAQDIVNELSAIVWELQASSGASTNVIPLAFAPATFVQKNASASNEGANAGSIDIATE